MDIVILILAMGLVTYLTRVSMVGLVGRAEPAPGLLRALGYVAPAVLAALIVPGVVAPTGAVDLSLQNTYLLGAVAATLAAWRTRSLFPTIVVGMGAFYLARLVFG